MEDKTPIVLIVLAGLAVAFLLWKRHKDAADDATKVAAGAPGFGAALSEAAGGSKSKAPPVPVSAPVTRGRPPTSTNSRVSTTTVPPVIPTRPPSILATRNATALGVTP